LFVKTFQTGSSACKAQLQVEIIFDTSLLDSRELNRFEIGVICEGYEHATGVARTRNCLKTVECSRRKICRIDTV